MKAREGDEDDDEPTLGCQFCSAPLTVPGRILCDRCRAKVDEAPLTPEESAQRIAKHILAPLERPR
jgi:hypothetical protein